MKPSGFGGFNYFMMVVDSVSMYVWIIFLVQKNEAGPKLKNFIVWLQNQFGKTVKTIVRDGGKEYIPNEEKIFAKQFGIVIRESAPRTPEQNGKAEVVDRHIIKKARSIRINAVLPENLWPLAVKHTVDVANLLPKKQLGWKTPHEILG
jgi:IS30 family transposase